MIVGLGIDIVDIDRIKGKIVKGNGFKDSVFSESEILDCEKKTNPYESFASRFAAKEAFLKALGTGITFEFELKELEVCNDTYGKPFVKYSEIVKTMLLEKLSIVPNVLVSLSHSKNQSVAVVIFED